MSLRNKLLASRLSIATEDFQEGSASDTGDAVQAAVDQVADKIVAAAAAQAVDAVGDVDSAAADEDGEDDAELDSGAEEILELNAEGDAVEEEEEAAEETADIAEGLESIALAMESTIAHGGLTPMAAQGYHIATEAYCARAGLDNAIPSMESFGGSGSRIAYTQISVENIRERAGRLWKALLEMLEKAREMAMAFFKKVFTMTGQLKGKAQGILKAADGLGGEKSESLEGSLLADLTVGGSAPSDIAAELTKLGELLSQSYKYAEGAVSYASAIRDGLSGLDAGSDEKFAAGVKSLIDSAAKSSPAFSAAGSDYKGSETDGVGLTGKQTEAHIGEVKVISLRLADANIDQSAAVRALSAQKNAVEIGKGTAPEKAATLNKEGIQAIANAVIAIIDQVDSYKDTAAKVDKALSEVTKGGKSFERVASKAETLSAENKKLVNPVISVVKSVPAVVSQPAQKLTQHALSVCRNALKYCAASVKAHSKGGKVAVAE